MPIYEYLCESCGNRYEKQESFSAKAKQKCPKCAKTANRVIFAPPVVFKGGGFYKTDSRGSDASESTVGSSTSSDSKPAVPDVSAASHGHSHGPGSHSHDTPSTPSKPETTTESAAAG